MTNPEAVALETAHLTHVAVETLLDTDLASAWQAVTDDIGAWWPAEFYAGGEPSTRSFHLEATPGGRMYEEWEGGGGLLWATVLSLEPGHRLELVGHTNQRWGGPSTWTGILSLVEEDGGVRLRFEEAAFGHIGGEYGAEKGKGWRFLFGGALKAHLEGTTPPAWDDL